MRPAFKTQTVGLHPMKPLTSTSPVLECLKTSAIQPSIFKLTSAVLKRAARRIGEAILFRTPVKVNATFYQMTNDRTTTFGVSDPKWTNGAKRNQNEQLYLYPQALLKQAIVTGTPKISQFDMELDFNSLAPYFYGGDDDGRNNNKKLVDFECNKD